MIITDYLTAMGYYYGFRHSSIDDAREIKVYGPQYYVGDFVYDSSGAEFRVISTIGQGFRLKKT